jgi:glycine/D-amino acid oxidase-like deaminating enzyme
MSPPVDAVRDSEIFPETADAVVIGGGIAGVAAAYYLAKKGLSVVIVEKGCISGEQSSRNWGWVRQTTRDRAELALIKLSLEMWGGLNEEIGGETGFRRTGIVYVTKNKADMAKWERWADLAREHQIHSHVLTAAEAQAMTPGCTQPWIGGLHTPSDGRAEPGKAVPAMAEAARRLGVSIFQNCAARGIETLGGKVAALVTEKGVIRTSRVLCASGVWSTLFCRRHGIDLPQVGVRGSVFSTTEAPAVVEGNLGTPGFTMRRRIDGGYTVAMRNRGRIDLTPDSFRYAKQFWPTYKQRWQHAKVRIGTPFFQALMQSRNWAFDEASPFEAMRIIDPEPDDAMLARGLAEVKEAFPALAGIEVARAWGGLIDHTPDQIPVISEVDSLPGFFLSTGYSGHGFGIGPGAGRLAADIVAGDRPIVDPTDFRYARMIDGSKLVPETADI